MAQPELLQRTYQGELRVRADGAPEERIIEGTVIPFGQVVSVQDSPTGPRYRETIARGATADLDASRVMLESLPRPGQGHNTHDGSILVGRGIEARQTDDQLWMAFRVSRTPAGDELMELARDGVLAELSAAFAPVDQRTRADGVIERTRINVRRVAAVEKGAYAAPITAVRAAQEGATDVAETAAAPAAETEEEQPAAATPAPKGDDRPNRTRVTVDVERAAAEQATVAELARAGGAPAGGLPGAYVTRAERVYGPNRPGAFLSDGWKARQGDTIAAERFQRHQAQLADIGADLERAHAWDYQTGELTRQAYSPQLMARAGDVLSSEIPGAYPNIYLPGLLTPRILKGRPMGAFYDRFPIADALPRIFPKVTTSTSVAVQSAEGAALSSTDFATTAVTVTPLIYGAYTDVSRQVLDGADPTANAMLMQDLIEAYAQASETVIKTAVEAGSTASGVAITAATPYAGVLANVVNYYTVRFKGARAAFIPSAEFSVLAAQADTTGRPLIPMIGAVNSDSQLMASDEDLEFALLTARGKLSYASTVNVNVFGRANDFVIFESAVAQFSYDQVVGPQAVRVGIWAYLVVGTRLGSLKVTAA